MSDFSQHWHKVVALLMHEFEITQFEITESTLAAFRREYGGKEPTVTFEESNGVMRIRLVTADQLQHILQ
jgi:hypothetical protein